MRLAKDLRLTLLLGGTCLLGMPQILAADPAPDGSVSVRIVECPAGASRKPTPSPQTTTLKVVRPLPKGSVTGLAVAESRGASAVPLASSSKRGSSTGLAVAESWSSGPVPTAESRAVVPASANLPATSVGPQMPGVAVAESLGPVQAEEPIVEPTRRPAVDVRFKGRPELESGYASESIRCRAKPGSNDASRNGRPATNSPAAVSDGTVHSFPDRP